MATHTSGRVRLPIVAHDQAGRRAAGHNLPTGTGEAKGIGCVIVERTKRGHLAALMAQVQERKQGCRSVKEVAALRFSHWLGMAA